MGRVRLLVSKDRPELKNTHTIFSNSYNPIDLKCSKSFLLRMNHHHYHPSHLGVRQVVLLFLGLLILPYSSFVLDESRLSRSGRLSQKPLIVALSVLLP